MTTHHTEDDRSWPPDDREGARTGRKSQEAEPRVIPFPLKPRRPPRRDGPDWPPGAA